jgi:hypothetical protein
MRRTPVSVIAFTNRKITKAMMRKFTTLVTKALYLISTFSYAHTSLLPLYTGFARLSMPGRGPAAWRRAIFLMGVL